MYVYCREMYIYCVCNTHILYRSIYYMGWECQSPTPRKCPVLNGNFVIDLCSILQDYNTDIKWDLPVRSCSVMWICQFGQIWWMCAGFTSSCYGSESHCIVWQIQSQMNFVALCQSSHWNTVQHENVYYSSWRRRQTTVNVIRHVGRWLLRYIFFPI